MTRRKEFGKRAKKEIIARATNSEGQICCEGCGLVLGFKRHEIDHSKADGLADQNAPKKKLTADDGQLLCKDCHKLKTKRDIQLIRKADRMKNFYTGATRPKGTIQSRPFAKSNKGKRLTDPAFLIQ